MNYDACVRNNTGNVYLSENEEVLFIRSNDTPNSAGVFIKKNDNCNSGEFDLNRDSVRREL